MAELSEIYGMLVRSFSEANEIASKVSENQTDVALRASARIVNARVKIPLGIKEVTPELPPLVPPLPATVAPAVRALLSLAIEKAIADKPGTLSWTKGLTTAAIEAYVVSSAISLLAKDMSTHFPAVAKTLTDQSAEQQKLLVEQVAKVVREALPAVKAAIERMLGHWPSPGKFQVLFTSKELAAIPPEQLLETSLELAVDPPQPPPPKFASDSQP